VDALDGELVVAVSFVEAIGVSLGVAISAGLDNAVLTGDGEVSRVSMGVDGSIVTSLSGCGLFNDGMFDAGGASASTDMLGVYVATRQTIEGSVHKLGVV
jgi:hypothetical protein